MRDERYVGNARGMFTPDNQSLLVGDHVIEYGPGSTTDGDGQPYVAIGLRGGSGDTIVILYKDEDGKVVVDVSGDPDRVLWNEATFNHDTTYMVNPTPGEHPNLERR